MLRARARCFAARHRGSTVVEFALVAPLLIMLGFSVLDLGRALLIWQQVNNAAQAIASAAEKLSVSADSTQTSLTSTQMQQAMTSIYAVIPGLANGSGNAFYPGKYSVTLSEVVFCPTRTAAAYASLGCTTGTGAQSAWVLWSSYLKLPAINNGHLLSGGAYYRPCNLSLVAEPTTWNSNSSTPSARLSQMVDPSQGNTTGVTLTPQIVADVQYQFKPFLGFVFPVSTTITFWGTAMLPTPYGDNTQAITYTAAANDTGIATCTKL